MKLVEFKSGERKEKLGDILEEYFSKFLNDSSFEKFKKDHIVYVSDRRIRGLDYPVKPRAKIVVVLREGDFTSPSVVFENKQIVILDKVIGLPTQGTLKKHEDNLYDQVRLHYLMEKNFPAGLPYVGLHHRLDRDTSGLVLMTKQRSVNKDVSDLFQKRKITKTYWAFCEKGESSIKPKWTYRCLIERGFSKRHPFIFKVSDKGDEAITDFKVLEEDDKFIG
ncbi:MAG: pseudouridine synthase, partial [Bdellovibrionales bacterium]|nr:pseudouridine synthase [Bdellovibrionales bacterium]